MSTSTRLSSIRQIAITVSDVEQAIEFYNGILGLDLLFKAGPNLVFLDAAGIRIMLTIPQGSGAVGANSILYFNVTDIEKVFNDLVHRGATCERIPQCAAKMTDHDLWNGFIRDADGNLVGLMEERRA